MLPSVSAASAVSVKAAGAVKLALLTGAVSTTLGAVLLVVLKRRAGVLAALIVSVTLAYHS